MPSHIPPVEGAQPFPEQAQLLFATEVAGVREAVGAIGSLAIPDELTPTEAVASLTHLFAPDQVRPISAYPGVSLQTKDYYGRRIRPIIRQGLIEKDATMPALSYQVGRAYAAGIQAGAIAMPPALNIGKNALDVDGNPVPYELRSQVVIEFGMGIRGLLSHLQTLRQQRYRVVAIQHTAAEVALLRGMAAFYKLPEAQLRFMSDGIKVGAIALAGEKCRADLLIASNVQRAGPDLQAGINRAGNILRDRGTLVARGPITAKDGLGYGELHGYIEDAPGLKVERDKKYGLRFGHRIVPTQLTVASRRDRSRRA